VGIPVSSCPLLFSLPDSLVPVRGFRPKLLGKLGSSSAGKQRVFVAEPADRRTGMAESKVTTDHDEIRRFVESRGGKPAAVKATGSDDDPGILRIDFPGGAGSDELEHLTWDEFFDKFEEQRLAMVYQDEKSTGEPSTFVKFVRRDD
jgi:hypothetical protein